MTPKRAEFLTKVERGDRFTWREIGYQWRFVRGLVDMFYLTPEEAFEQGIVDADERDAAISSDMVLMEPASGQGQRLRLTEEGRAQLSEYRIKHGH